MKINDLDYTAIVILEAKEGKETELKNALIEMVKHSRAEKTCFEYRMHQDNHNPNKFIFYEKWESKEAHQEQFNKSYVNEFIEKSRNLLAKPYEAYFAKEIQ